MGPGGGNTDLRRKWSDDRQEPVGNDAVRFGGRMDGIPENVIGARPGETLVEQRHVAKRVNAGLGEPVGLGVGEQ